MPRSSPLTRPFTMRSHSPASARCSSSVMRGSTVTVRAGARDLLADDRREVAVAGKHELLDLSAQGIARRAGGNAGRIDAVLIEDGRVVEAEQRVDTAVVQEAE